MKTNPSGSSRPCNRSTNPSQWRISRALSGAEWSIWLLLAMIPPLVVNLWGQQPFELPKALLVRTLVWMLSALLLTGVLRSVRSLRQLPLGQLWAANPLLGPLGLLAFVIAVSTVLAADVGLSLWGSAERGQGAVTLLTYLLLCGVAAARLRAISPVRRILAAMVLAGALLVLAGLFQAVLPLFGVHPPLGLVSDARSPVFASLGRANFLGAYLALLTPLALALLLTARVPARCLLWTAVLTGLFLVIGLTLARAAWLATLFSLALFFLLYTVPTRIQPWRPLAWAGTAVLFVAGPAAVLQLGLQQTGSLAARLAIWKGALELIRQRPLLGYGADALGLIFPRVYPPELVYLQGRDHFVDRAHNLLLDWAIIAGLPGLLAFLLVIGVFVLVTVRGLTNAPSGEKRVLLAGVLAAVAGNLTNNLVSFDVTATATASWLLMGMGIGLALGVDGKSGPAPVQEDARSGRWVLVGLLFAATIAAAWQFNGRALSADIAARTAHLHAQNGEWEQAVLAAERAAAFWPVEPTHHLNLAQAYWQRARSDPSSASRWLAQAEDALERAQRLRPDDAAIRLHTARFYGATARRFGADSHAQAVAAYRRAASLAPTRAAIYTAWGEFHLQTGEPEEAATLLRRAVRLDASSGAAYLHLAVAELALGRVEEARADYREAVRLLSGSGQAHASLTALGNALYSASSDGR